MVDEIDIYRSASVLIVKYGDQAKHNASLQALLSQENLNIEGLSVWCRIIKAIEVLQQKNKIRTLLLKSQASL